MFECKKAMELSKDILEKSLKYSMFKENNQKTIENIIYELISRDVTKDHSRNLSAEKCKEIGLNITNIEEDEELQDIILSIHHACISYFNQKNACKLYSNQNGVFLIMSNGCD